MKILLFFLLLFGSLHAQQWSVVCSKKIKPKSLAEIKSFYLKKRRYFEGVKIVPINLSYSNPARIDFMSMVLEIEKSRWQRYWDKMHFKGFDTPVVVESVEAMRMYLVKIPGSIGYLPSKMNRENFYEIGNFESK